eukprot:scaffold2512_cov164-Amphora_coffeaeformis.AAC.10
MLNKSAPQGKTASLVSSQKEQSPEKSEVALHTRPATRDTIRVSKRQTNQPYTPQSCKILLRLPLGKDDKRSSGRQNNGSGRRRSRCGDK